MAAVDRDARGAGVFSKRGRCWSSCPPRVADRPNAVERGLLTTRPVAVALQCHLATVGTDVDDRALLPREDHLGAGPERARDAAVDADRRWHQSSKPSPYR